MRGSLLLIVSCLLVVEVLPASTQAQLIDVGPGSVRGPFVQVQRRGRLRDRIRSRFREDEVEVEEEKEPLHQRYPGAIQPPPVPPAMPLRSTTRPFPSPSGATGMPDRQSLHTSLILAEAELDRQLNASTSGDAYRKHLRVGRLSELLLQNPATTPTEQTRGQLQQMLDIYNRTLIDPRQRWVSRLSGFERVQAGLTQLLASAEEPQDPSPEHVSVKQKPAEPAPLRTPVGAPQPTQVLPSVRDSY